MLLPVVADQGLADRLVGGLAALVAQGRKHARVALAGHDGADDAHAGGAGDVRHDVVQLKVHLHERLLHVLDVRGRIVQQPLALAQVVPQRRNPELWAEAGPQQPILMQPLQPLGVGHVGLAAGHVFGVAGVDQHHSEPALFQDLENRDPIDAGALHGDCLDPALLEPVSQPVQVGGEGAEAAHRFRIAVRADRRHVQGGANVDRGCMGVDGRHLPPPAGSFGFWHQVLLD